MREFGRRINSNPLGLFLRDVDAAKNELDSVGSCEERVVIANIGLVVKEALRFFNRYGVDVQLELEDYLQEGAIALTRAVRGYDPQRGSLASYAVPAIRRQMTKAHYDYGTGMGVGYRLKQTPHVVDVDNKLTQSRNSAPNRTQLIDAVINTFGVTEKYATEMVDIANGRYTVTLRGEKPINKEEGDASILLYISDPDSDPADVAAARVDIERVIAALSKNPAMHRGIRILVKRFGLNDTEAKSLDAIGKEEGFTRERIRQLQNETLEAAREILQGDIIEDEEEVVA